MEIVQFKPGDMSNSSHAPQPQIAGAEITIEALLEERQVVRILQPALRRQVEEAVQLNPALSQYVLSNQGEIYLRLNSVHNAQRRGQFYDLVQRYQIDPNVNLEKLPNGLRACLQAQKHRQGRLMGAIVLGALVGILMGLIGMALSVLLTITVGAAYIPGEMVTAITFVVCLALGWAAATYYLWHKYPLGFWRH